MLWLSWRKLPTYPNPWETMAEMRIWVIIFVFFVRTFLVFSVWGSFPILEPKSLFLQIFLEPKAPQEYAVVSAHEAM